MLVGGGELHDRWESLVAVEMPLSRGIERFTGITQAMVDRAPPRRGGAARAGAADGGPRAGGPQRPVRPPRAGAGVRARRAWSGPTRPCCARWRWRASCAPLVRRRGLALAGRVARDRGRGGAPRAARRPDLRARAVRAVQAAVRARGHRRGRGGAVPLATAAPGRARGTPPPSRGGAARPLRAARATRACTCSATSAGGRCTWASRCRCARAPVRTSCAPAGWTERAEVVDYKPTNSELGALVLENRLIKQWRPPGNRALKRTDKWVYVRCRLDVEYPILEVSPEPASGRALSIGPLRGRKLATRAGRPSRPRSSGCATAAGCCTGASIPRSTARWAAAARPAWAIWTPTPTAARSTWRWGCSSIPTARATRCWASSSGGCARRPRRGATRPRRRCCAGASASSCCWTAWAGCCGPSTPTRGW